MESLKFKDLKVGMFFVQDNYSIYSSACIICATSKKKMGLFYRSEDDGNGNENAIISLIDVDEEFFSFLEKRQNNIFKREYLNSDNGFKTVINQIFEKGAKIKIEGSKSSL